MNMNKMNYRLAFKALLLSSLLLPLAGCGGGGGNGNKNGAWLWILHPNGPLASASIYYLIVDVLLLGVVIVPATALVIWAFWRYRRGGRGRYDPGFNHSLRIEAIVWGGPILLVGVMSYFSVEGSYAVGPFNPDAVNAAVAKARSPDKPLKIDVITTNWQWLFVYPQLHIAAANRLVVPVKRKVEMRLTSVDTTNDFYVLKIINQMYIMPGMRTKHNFYLDRTGDYRGFSTEFSGPGFSWMNYKMRVVTPTQFQQWVTKARAAPLQMTWPHFKEFAKPTVNTSNAWTLYSDVAPGLFNKVIRQVKAGKLVNPTPMAFTDDMQSAIFAQHSTGTIEERGND